MPDSFGCGLFRFPLDLLDYIYAVLHSPAYRAKYREFLKIDFSRVPYPTDAGDFRRLVKLAGELRQFHLMEHPKSVWEFYIGGYQPAQKWLKDRRGRALSYEDIAHWMKIVVALGATGRLMQEIDNQ